MLSRFRRRYSVAFIGFVGLLLGSTAAGANGRWPTRPGWRSWSIRGGFWWEKMLQWQKWRSRSIPRVVELLVGLRRRCGYHGGGSHGGGLLGG